MSENGKGDTPRPMSVDTETYREHFDKTFGRKRYWWELRDEKKASEERIEAFKKEAILKELTQGTESYGTIQSKESGSNPIR